MLGGGQGLASGQQRPLPIHTRPQLSSGSQQLTDASWWWACTTTSQRSFCYRFWGRDKPRRRGGSGQQRSRSIPLGRSCLVDHHSSLVDSLQVWIGQLNVLGGVFARHSMNSLSKARDGRAPAVARAMAPWWLSAESVIASTLHRRGFYPSLMLMAAIVLVVDRIFHLTLIFLLLLSLARLGAKEGRLVSPRAKVVDGGFLGLR